MTKPLPRPDVQINPRRLGPARLTAPERQALASVEDESLRKVLGEAFIQARSVQENFDEIREWFPVQPQDVADELREPGEPGPEGPEGKAPGFWVFPKSGFIVISNKKEGTGFPGEWTKIRTFTKAEIETYALGEGAILKYQCFIWSRRTEAGFGPEPIGCKLRLKGNKSGKVIAEAPASVEISTEIQKKEAEFYVGDIQLGDTFEPLEIPAEDTELFLEIEPSAGESYFGPISLKAKGHLEETIHFPTGRGEEGEPGEVGPAGEAGKTILNGEGPPTEEIGEDGDFYIDTTAWTIYGPKVEGAWGEPTPLAIGPEGRWASLRYRYLTDTEETEPAAGALKFDASGTSLRISETDADGGAIAAYLATWDDSTTTGTRGFLIVRKIGTPAIFATYKVKGALVDKGAWDTLPVELIAFGGVFANEDPISLEFYRTGDQGKEGATGAGLPVGSNLTRGVAKVKMKKGATISVGKSIAHLLGKTPATVNATFKTAMAGLTGLAASEYSETAFILIFQNSTPAVEEYEIEIAWTAVT